MRADASAHGESVRKRYEYPSTLVRAVPSAIGVEMFTGPCLPIRSRCVEESDGFTTHPPDEDAARPGTARSTVAVRPNPELVRPTGYQRVTAASMAALIEPGHIRLLCYSAVVGLVGASVGAAYLGTLAWAERWLWPDRYSALSHAAIMIAVGLAITGLYRLLGDPGETGALLGSVHDHGGPASTRALRSLIPVSLLSIAAGGGIGPEPPLMQTTATLATWIGRRRRVAEHGLTVLTATGMATGLTVLLGAPIGASVFALEFMHRKGLEYYEALLPACVGSLSGYGLYTLLTHRGLNPMWPFPHDPGPVRPSSLLIGLGAGIGGAAVCYVFDALLKGARRLAGLIPPALRPPAAGLVLGLLGMVLPGGMTYGEGQLGQLAQDSRATAALLVLTALGHLLSASVTLAGRRRGGIIIPMFLIGYCLGRATLTACGLGTGAMTLALCMTVACNTGMTKTPLGSSLVIAQAAGIAQLPAMTVAALTSLALTTRVTFVGHQRFRSRFPTVAQ